MNKKFLSLLVAGALFAGIGLNAECLAAPHGDRGVKNPPHKEFRQQPKGHNAIAKKGPKKDIKKAPPKKEFKNQRGNSRFDKKNEHKKEIKKFQKNRKQEFKKDRGQDFKAKRHDIRRDSSDRFGNQRGRRNHRDFRRR